jgi:hypothetical protein
VRHAIPVAIALAGTLALGISAYSTLAYRHVSRDDLASPPYTDLVERGQNIENSPNQNSMDRGRRE